MPKPTLHAAVAKAVAEIKRRTTDSVLLSHAAILESALAEATPVRGAPRRNDYEEIRRLKDQGLSHEQVRAKTGASLATITRALREGRE